MVLHLDVFLVPPLPLWRVEEKAGEVKKTSHAPTRDLLFEIHIRITTLPRLPPATAEANEHQC